LCWVFSRQGLTNCLLSAGFELRSSWALPSDSWQYRHEALAPGITTFFWEQRMLLVFRSFFSSENDLESLKWFQVKPGPVNGYAW
jgi:hypothetical protein